MKQCMMVTLNEQRTKPFCAFLVNILLIATVSLASNLNVNEVLAQNSNANQNLCAQQTHSFDTLKRLADEMDQVERHKKRGWQIYRETRVKIEYQILEAGVLGEDWLPEATVEALRTYFLIRSLQETWVAKGKAAFLRPLFKRTLRNLELAWSRRCQKESSAEAQSELEGSYEKFYAEIIQELSIYAQQHGKELSRIRGPWYRISAPISVKIVTTPPNGQVWLVHDTDYRLALNLHLEPPWREVGGNSVLLGTYRYKISWDHGQHYEISIAPFIVKSKGVLTLPGAVLNPYDE